MKKHVLFIQGGGDDGYQADGRMVDSLKAALGNGYEVSYPEMQDDESVPDFGWPRQIGEAINNIRRYFGGTLAGRLPSIKTPV